ncbi:pectate lyase family protein [Hymenobacter chitinivorans]|uniref:Pectate lyase n=1 Tax=Hymenobacter chitinivorans DSM 11115 TaxID=1121954 RepID=A0A2M9BS78_9BACT|nr:pectate lyase [Hymenobacter chitinivorans]PJJ60806.1 pectate lyase [Hymenobacter chitinivorans DSM 11115]
MKHYPSNLPLVDFFRFPQVGPALVLAVLLGAAACAKKPLESAAVPQPAGATVAAAPASTAPSFGLVGFAGENGGTTGGAGGRTVAATTLAELTEYAKSKEPLIITIAGTISGGTEGASVRVASNKTLLGVGKTGFLEGVGLTISDQRNIIVQNLRFTMSTVTNTKINDEKRPQVAVNDGDCITIQGASQNLWFDHCEFFNLDPVAQPNQDLYDGLIDAKGASAYITISWCYFHDHHKCHLIGNSDKDAGDRKVTFHHNYYSNITERVPVYRFGTGHVFNNYYKHVYGTGVNSRMGACLRVEQNYFEDTKNPITTKNSSVPGNWDAAGNLYVGCTGAQPTTSTCSFQPPYQYAAVLNETAKVKEIVVQGAGVGKL